MTFLIAAAAGLLTSLSPCVITALPFIVGSAMNKNKYGPLFIAGGLIFSFVTVGVTFALTSKVAGIDQESLRMASAVIFILIGFVFIIPWLYNKMTFALQRLADRSNNAAARIGTDSSVGFVLLGILLGFIWSPCSGPTLGFAVTLVAKQGEILKGSIIMLVFGIAASIPLLAIAYISRGIVQNNRGKIQNFYTAGKYLMAILLILYGVMTLTGLDRGFETWLLQQLPESWLNAITTL